MSKESKVFWIWFFICFFLCQLAGLGWCLTILTLICYISITLGAIRPQDFPIILEDLKKIYKKL